jgi:hypothetical protein
VAKRGLEGAKVPTVLEHLCKNTGWALCVGAGTSIPAFPSWQALVARLVKHDAGTGGDILSEALLRSFAPDALIQAAHDRLGLKDEKFAALLAEELYRDFQNTLGANWKEVARVLGANHQGELQVTQWELFLTRIKGHYPSISAIAVADVVARAIKAERGPVAILSFNAEPLLFALLNAHIACKHLTASRRAIFDRVTRATTDRKAGRVPYVFCHGLLPIPSILRSGPKNVAIDKLVFSESDYLQMANTAFSWQSSVFLDTCVSKSVVFVGVSLSDPNMRRWLAWVQRNRLNELKEVFGAHEDTTQHYWLNKKPSAESEALWIESAVAHLGVRLVWLERWDLVGDVLATMLDL